EELQWVEYALRPRDVNTGATGKYLGPAAASLASLDLLYGDKLITHVTLSPGRTLIGRTSDNDLQIKSKFISRHHAQITTDRFRCIIEDLNSTNGIFIESRRVKQHVLRDGDVIHIGEHKLVYHDARPAGDDRQEQFAKTVHIPDELRPGDPDDTHSFEDESGHVDETAADGNSEAETSCGPSEDSLRRFRRTPCGFGWSENRDASAAAR